MASLESFISVMDEFLSELSDTFPNVSKLKTYRTKFGLIKGTNPRKVLNTFMDSVLPIENVILNKDESYILNGKSDFLEDMGATMWWTANLSPNTKDAIWRYLNTLLFLGKALTALPEGMMSEIESIAEKCAENMEGNPLGGDGIPDIGMLMKSVQNMISPEMIEQIGENMNKK